jgi:excisionase family DNA binding protein
MTGDFLSTHEVARACGVTPVTVGRWIRDRKLRGFATPGGHYRVGRGDLERFMRVHGIPVGAAGASESGGVLAVDDHPAVRRFLRDAVEDLEAGLPVWEAADGFDAGRLVVLRRPRLVFLDLRLPGIDGFAVCARIKSDPLTAETEVVGITGWYGEEGMRRAVRAGARACLRKPLDVARVQSCVRSVFGLVGGR